MHELRRRILAMIERRDRFEGEIRHALRDAPADRVEEALAGLRPYLDDRRALDAYLAAHTGRAARGRDAMRRELVERHAPPEPVEEVLAALPEEPERAAALLRAERKARTRAQAGRFLVSRGFDEDAVEGAIERVFGEG